MKKNTAGQVIGVQMTNIVDGEDFTGTVTVYLTGDGGVQTIGGVGAGICTHEGRGLHTYTPSQAETNFDHIAFTFDGVGAITATVQVYPTFPQTGDSFVRLGAPVGASISADVAGVPDAFLKRDMSAVTGEAARSPLNALRFLRNKWSVVAGTLTVTKEDDAATAWTAVTTGTAGADPITTVDPA